MKLKIVNIMSQLKYALRMLGISFGFMGFYFALAIHGYDIKIIIYFWFTYLLLEWWGVGSEECKDIFRDKTSPTKERKR